MSTKAWEMKIGVVSGMLLAAVVWGLVMTVLWGGGRLFHDSGRQDAPGATMGRGAATLVFP